MAYEKKKKRKNSKKTGDADYKAWVEELKDFQESDLDQRDQARESDRFLLEEDGQWEDNIRRTLDDQARPRYTFDKITPVIETMMADIEDMDFGCNVKPEGGEANKDTALTYEGMIRGIQNHSKTETIFRKSARRIIRRGFDAWVVKAKYKDAWSFDQDLFVEQVPNAINRVWVSNTCNNEDSSDSPVAYVLSSLSPASYDEQYPKGSKVSVDDGDFNEQWENYEPEVITIAERYYRKDTMREVAQLTNGDVIELNDEWDKIKDEKAAQGITIAEIDGAPRIKKVKDYRWYHCVFDGGGILEAERVTVFKSNPVVTLYGNHELLGQNSKTTYSGITLKEMDAQRVHNYAKSREIEEGALSPRPKWWMTKEQAKGHQAQLSRMNVSSDPVQFYNNDPVNPNAPFHGGQAQVNPNLANLGAQMANDIKEQASVTDAMMGQMNGRESEDAVRMRIDRGTASTRKWVNALINGIQRVCDILIETIPEVYDTKRQFAIVGIDGTEDMVTLNDETYDEQTRQMVKTNILNAGKYKVTADAGAAFTNRIEAGLHAMLEYAAIDPTVVQTGGDLMLKAIDAPLVDQMAERKRAQLLQAGMIPEDQMTDEELEQAQMMAQQPKEPTPEDKLAQGELLKGQAAVMGEETDRLKAQTDIFNAETKRIEAITKAQEAGVKIENMQVDTVGKQIDNMGKVADNQGKQLDNVKKAMEPIQIQ